MTTTPSVIKLESVNEPLAERLVNAPVEGVVAPIAVLLIPVAVALKLADVMSKLFTPVEMLEPERPDKLSVPAVAVRLRVPVVRFKPFDAVSVPADVIVPVPVVRILPVVERIPSSAMVSVVTPLLCTSRAFCRAALVSLITKADEAVPVLVNVNALALSEASVKSIFPSESEALIVFPEL